MSWTWDAVCEDPQLQDLPYKLELNGDGELLMNAVKVQHAFVVYEIQRLLMQHRPDGFSPPEFPILTSERRRQTIADSAARIAPEICVEVMSPGNTMAQMQKKGRLYLQAGALEYWICDEAQKLHFFSQAEELPQSVIIPSFPSSITLE